MTPRDSQKIIAVLENPVADIKAQFAEASDREASLIDEKSKRLDMLSGRKRKSALMPCQKNPRKSSNWLLRLVGAR